MYYLSTRPIVGIVYILVASASLVNAFPFLEGRNNENHHPTKSSKDSHDKPCPSKILLPKVVLNATGPELPSLKNTTLPVPVPDNSTVKNKDKMIVVPVNTTRLSPDNGDVSVRVSAADDSSVVVGDIPATPVSEGNRVLFRPGTYENSPTIADSGASASRLKVKRDYLSALSEPESNPLFPDDLANGCNYTYQSVLGGASRSSPAGGLWALEGYVWLTPANVRQGTIGDCGVSCIS
jgi:hypothetical protein